MGGKLRQFFDLDWYDGEIETFFEDSDGYDVAEGTRKRKVSYSRMYFS